MLLDTLHAALGQINHIAAVFCAPVAASNLAAMPISNLETLYIERSVGRHIRHVGDHTQAFLDGLANSNIDYNFRTRNSETERNAAFALQRIQTLQASLLQVSQSLIGHSVRVHSEVSFERSQSSYFQSSVGREVLYLINHTIHHAAYIKLNLSQVGISLPEHIGMAPCTLSFARHSQACAA